MIDNDRRFIDLDKKIWIFVFAFGGFISDRTWNKGTQQQYKHWNNKQKRLIPTLFGLMCLWSTWSMAYVYGCMVYAFVIVFVYVNEFINNWSVSIDNDKTTKQMNHFFLSEVATNTKDWFFRSRFSIHFQITNFRSKLRLTFCKKRLKLRN